MKAVRGLPAQLWQWPGLWGLGCEVQTVPLAVHRQPSRGQTQLGNPQSLRAVKRPTIRQSAGPRAGVG